MPPRSEILEIMNAWRALAASTETSGHQVIDILGVHHLRVKAGRLDGEEALLFGFGGSPRTTTEVLPLGQGFTLSLTEELAAPGEVWYTLRRRAAGDIDMFGNMAVDVLNAVLDFQGSDPTARLRLFLNRVRAWQDFMRKGQHILLSSEEEVGLFGELITMRSLIDAGLTSSATAAAWRGPYDGLHDFVLGAGGLEVKTCARQGRFIARIGDLEQLDDSMVRPLHLVAVRVAQADDGQSLPEKIQEVRDILAGEFEATEAFENGLLRLGYVDALASSYVRRYVSIDIRVYVVDGDFPRLFSANVPSAVTRASYDLDIDTIPTEQIDLIRALENCGAI